MRILIDKYVPYLRGVLEPYAEVRYLEPEEFTPAAVWEADALIVRTRTKINAALLEGSRVRLVCTATIGYDHIDTAYCESHHIAWTNAPGCNAQAVCDYVEEALNELERMQRLPSKPVLGVVGCGHVGSLVADMAARRGYEVLVNDPPKGLGVSLMDIAHRCDIITFHTPLCADGPYPTYHLCNSYFLSECKPDAIIINAARGGIVDEAALLLSGNDCIIDTWEGEPRLNHDLLDHALLASQHIAGYSIRGKINASEACLRKVCEVFDLDPLTIDERQVPEHGDIEEGWLRRVSHTIKANPMNFETLRETYRLR